MSTPATPGTPGILTPDDEIFSPGLSSIALEKLAELKLTFESFKEEKFVESVDAIRNSLQELLRGDTYEIELFLPQVLIAFFFNLDWDKKLMMIVKKQFEVQKLVFEDQSPLRMVIYIQHLQNMKKFFLVFNQFCELCSKVDSFFFKHIQLALKQNTIHLDLIQFSDQDLSIFSTGFFIFLL